MFYMHMLLSILNITRKLNILQVVTTSGLQ